MSEDEADCETVKFENDIPMECKFYCQHCNKFFPTQQGLASHGRVHSAKERPYTCTVCFKSFIQLTNLNVHKRIHTGDNPYKCMICRAAFTTKISLICHKRTHTDGKAFENESGLHIETSDDDVDPKNDNGIPVENKFYCKPCNKFFPTKQGLASHGRTHSDKERPYTCNVCYKDFTRLGSLEVHKRIHTGERPYKCTECEEAFTTKFNLISHKRIHTGEKPYECNLCEESFSHRWQLVSHNNKFHTGKRKDKRNLTCTECKITLTTKSNFRQHKKAHLPKLTDRFVCQVCGLELMSKNSLLIHSKIHTGERPYSCELCGKTFTQSGHLKRHLKTHTEEKSFECYICQQRFQQKWNVMAHMKTHTAARPFECDLCEKTFRQKWSLGIHKKKVHLVEST